MQEYVQHNLIIENSIDKREYQDYLVSSGGKDSTLIVLPTGTGKTIVSLRITADRILDNHGGTSLLLAPTKPLVEQHYETYSSLLDIADEQIIMFTGEVRPAEREKIWSKHPSVVLATPQVIENDLISNRISLKKVNHLTFDECHRATGDYAYVYIADKYIQQSDNPLVTGLSASPGDDKEDILNICNNINVNGIEIITEEDEMIREYIHETDIETRFIDISDEILDIRDKLQEIYKSRLEELYEDDFVDSRSKTLSQGKLNQARGRIQREIKKGNDSAYEAMSVWAESMKINRAIDLIETQGVEAFLDYYERLKEELRSEDSSRAVERLLSDPKMQRCEKMAEEFEGTYEKIDVLKSELVNTVKIEHGKCLIFTKSRDTVEYLVDTLSDDFTVGRLVGQSDSGESDGMTQTQQKRAVSDFSSGEHEILVSTQIGEEGLDISEVDLVVFYEPASKGIEQIQRQGRTGRTQRGRVLILIGNDTRDVGMYYKSKSNVEQMKSDVSELQDIGNLQEEIQKELNEGTEQVTLRQVAEQDEVSEPEKDNANQDDSNIKETDVAIENKDNDKFTIVADSRETNSSVVQNLDLDEDVNVKVENNMEVGDYVVSNNMVIERKDVDDFYDTITGDRSLFDQVRNMTNSYEKSVLLIEGDHRNLYSKNIHPNAIRGVLATAVSDFDTTIIESVDEEDTSGILKYLAKKEQDDETTKVNQHGNKDTGSLTSRQEYIVSSVEGIGPKTAEELLDEFGDIISIVNAETDDLQDVEGIGEVTAENIYSIMRAEYNN